MVYFKRTDWIFVRVPNQSTTPKCKPHVTGEKRDDSRDHVFVLEEGEGMKACSGRLGRVITRVFALPNAVLRWSDPQPIPKYWVDARTIAVFGRVKV